MGRNGGSQGKVRGLEKRYRLGRKHGKEKQQRWGRLRERRRFVVRPPFEGQVLGPDVISSEIWAFREILSTSVVVGSVMSWRGLAGWWQEGGWHQGKMTCPLIFRGLITDGTRGERPHPHLHVIPILGFLVSLAVERYMKLWQQRPAHVAANYEAVFETRIPLQRSTVSMKWDHLNGNAFHSIKCYTNKGITFKYLVLTQLHVSSYKVADLAFCI